ncbi:hypothetical protein PMI09_01735 [Rhizobium sp. CF122]|uniref:hypothetical protein n=1 Tax=Rhizobium sp. CF122 TaxID=1144312 RepID=UPI00027174E1|nr:hypothetical protein [Rhizobium sp. CF122]EJL56619.1 hypothetical protein PMI09_01735 [Rhizobium sp. CF122]
MIEELLQGRIVEEISLEFEANSDAMDFVLSNNCFDLVLSYKFEKLGHVKTRAFIFKNIYRYIYGRESRRMRIPSYGRGVIRRIEVDKKLLDSFFAHTPLGDEQVFTYVVDVLGAGVIAVFSGDEVAEVAPETYSSVKFFD